jgi:cholesterol oxidase
MTFLMSMMQGLEGVRAAICSALALFPITSTLNEVKAGLNLGSFLTLLGEETITPDFDSENWEDKLADEVLRLFPSQGRYRDPVERRIQMIYGAVYDHDQIDPQTHAVMHEIFGVANLATFNHIALLVRKGMVLDSQGRDVYLPHLDRLNFPISFIHGLKNKLFLPAGTAKTLELLRRVNDPRNYKRFTIPEYAHMDLFAGRNAARDIFPLLAAELDRLQ